MATATPGRAEAWSRYWASGARHSCAGSFAQHYGPGIQAWWRAQCARLGEGDCLLELGCGNGSLIRFLSETDIRPGRIVAVDAARLDGAWLQALPEDFRRRVSLHPATAANAVPLAPGSVNCVVSQFAFEYFADEPAWRELQRLLAPRATLSMVVHQRDSLLYRGAVAESGHCGWLLAAGGPLELAARMLALLAAAGPQGRAALEADAEARALRERFNGSFRELEARAAGEFGDVLHETAAQVMQILAAAARGDAGAPQRLLSLTRNVEDNRLRVAELVTAARDRAGIEQWRQRLLAAGCAEVQIGEVAEAGRPFGWTLAAQRS